MDDFDFLFKKAQILIRFCFQYCNKLECPQNCLPCSIRLEIKDIEKKLDEKNEII